MKPRTSISLLGGIAVAALLTGGASLARAEQITLNALMEDVPETTIIEGLLPEFEKETGIKVNFQKLVYS
jgi:multiple sugar transport system substrate-binding protein